MVPLAICVVETTGDLAERMLRFLGDIGCADAWEAEVTDLAPDVVLGDEGFIGGFRARGLQVVGIDIIRPGSGHIDVIPKCYMGATGSLWLLERIVNGLLEVA